MSRTTFSACTLAVVLALAVSAKPAAAQGSADGRRYGFAAGLAFDLEPAEHVGLALGASVTMPVGGLLSARGTLFGVITDDGFAVIPTLSGVVAVGAGPIELAVDASIHVFGVARRKSETIFAIFGVGGGASLMVAPSQSWRIGVRGDLSWLPKTLSAPIEDPKRDAANTFLYVTAMLVVEIRAELID